MENLSLSGTACLDVRLPGLKHFKSGKVREIFDLGDQYLFVATDRISAFDCIMPNGIPGKGSILTQISHFWFDHFQDLVRDHRASKAKASLPESLSPWEDLLKNRSMLVHKTKPLAIECVVRGYLAGSGWKEYQQSRSVCGVPLPANLLESSELPEPIFTPATKAEEGHDENISFERASQIVGPEIAEQVRTLSLNIYQRARTLAEKKGILIADTKFEFGLMDDEIILIDEVLTPDSSRFWPAQTYQPGRSQPSYDKQFVRDYLEGLDWDKCPPSPPLPEDIVRHTQQKYMDAFHQLTGRKIEAAPLALEE